jgi:2-dehydropantoate 2-reductase
MQIAVIGPGAIGSTFAFQLSRAGHDVTVVARGGRLEQLRRDGAIVKTDGERANVAVAGELDATTAWDLVLVTVLVSQVDVQLPTLGGSNAKAVMFMFNTFGSLDRLRDAVGPHRFAFGFPAIVASLHDGRLSSSILRRGMSTTVTDPFWAKVFSDVGIPSAVIVPLAIAGGIAQRRGSGLSKGESVKLSRAMDEGLRLVRHLGNSITPAPMAVVERMPVRALAAMLWMLTRLRAFTRTLGVAPDDEPRMLIDEMSAAAPGRTPALQAVRP